MVRKNVLLGYIYNQTSMPKFKLLLLVVFAFYIGESGAGAQVKLEGGPYLGVSWYNGDLNPNRQFQSIQPAFGGIVRYSVNDRIAFRGGALLAGISGDYPQQSVYLPTSSDDAYHFNREVLDLTALLELNFFSFDHPTNKESVFTPYFSLGIGSVFYKRYTEDNGNHDEKPTFVLSLPFGAGVKWKVNDWVNVGAEWTLRKTFVDDLDVVGQNNAVNGSNPLGFQNTALTHNNDWYSVVGVYATFNLYTGRDKCRDGF
jgi:hypothetical protein